VLVEPGFAAAIVPALLVAHSAVLIGTVVSVSVLPIALSSSVIVGHTASP
jgi:hypothetical protein